MRVCLFEDKAVSQLEPLCLTRPAFELLCGQTSLAAKQSRHFAPCDVGVLVRPYLTDICRLQSPGLRVNDFTWLRAEPTILVNGRWLPPPVPAADMSGPCVAMIGDEVAYAVVGPDRLTYCSSNTIDDCLETWQHTLPHCQAGGRLVAYLWDLVHVNAEQLTLDFATRAPCDSSAAISVVGPADRLLIDPTARIDPLVVADTTAGPVVVDREAVVTAFTRLEGPCYIGPKTHVQGAKIRAGTTLGPCCRIGGEVEASIVHGYSNKYHDGFLGHAYVGEWVNLGAGTSNSDLRNDYGEVMVIVGGRPIPTGSNKVGCFLGDHTKTGLGTLLNTGTHAGAFCNLLPAGRLTPKYVPSFCTLWNGVLQENVDHAQLMTTAKEVMRRRGQVFTNVHADLYRDVCKQTAAERYRVFRETEQRRLRRSA